SSLTHSPTVLSLPPPRHAAPSLAQPTRATRCMLLTRARTHEALSCPRVESGQELLVRVRPHGPQLSREPSERILLGRDRSSGQRRVDRVQLALHVGAHVLAPSAAHRMPSSAL